MKYIVTLSTEAVVEGKNKQVAARKAALFFTKALAGLEPENCEGRKAERVHFYCSPDEYQGGIEGQGQNDADLSAATLKDLAEKAANNPLSQAFKNGDVFYKGIQ